MSEKIRDGSEGKEDLYKDVPHQGGVFEEGGRKYYWNFLEGQVGRTVDKINRGYRDDMGGKFGSRQHVRAVEERVVGGRKITKWEVLEGHGDEMRGDPNPKYGQPGGNLDMPDYETYRKMYPSE